MKASRILIISLFAMVFLFAFVQVEDPGNLAEVLAWLALGPGATYVAGSALADAPRVTVRVLFAASGAFALGGLRAPEEEQGDRDDEWKRISERHGQYLPFAGRAARGRGPMKVARSSGGGKAKPPYVQVASEGVTGGATDRLERGTPFCGDRSNQEVCRRRVSATARSDCPPMASTPSVSRGN